MFAPKYNHEILGMNACRRPSGLDPFATMRASDELLDEVKDGRGT
jgi:hypothetical protein